MPENPSFDLPKVGKSNRFGAISAKTMSENPAIYRYNHIPLGYPKGGGEGGGAAMMTGKNLKAARLRAGLTQQQLADKTGFHRLAVGYWENKDGTFSARYGAPEAFAKALDMKHFSPPIRTHAAWGFTDVEKRWIEQELARLAKSRAQRLLLARVRCNAKTRKGTLCKALSESGKRRCKFHGGRSTGPKTQAGREAISRAQKARWAKWRASKGVKKPFNQNTNGG